MSKVRVGIADDNKDFCNTCRFFRNAAGHRCDIQGMMKFLNR